MTPREVLLKAAALVERGWCQGHYALDDHGNPALVEDDASCFCAEGAIIAAGRTDSGSDFMETVRVLGRAIGVHESKIIAWNDAPGRTQAEVVAALRAAAETCA